MRATKRSDALKLTQCALFDLSHAFSADAEDCRDLFGCALTFVRDVNRAVTRRTQAVLAIAAVLKVIAAQRVAAGHVCARVRAFVNQGESPRAPVQQHRAVGVPSAHVSI